MKAILIEDEKNSRELLRTAIDNFVDGIEIVGEAEDVVSGISSIHEYKPDLVFLDIELPDGTGFDILDGCAELDFSVIFVTAFDTYAIKAIRYSAIDYLTKPLDLEDLEQAVKRVISKKASQKENIRFLKDRILKPEEAEEKIIVPSHNGYEMIKLNDIIAIEAENNYVFFILEDGRKLLASQALSYYEDLLPEHSFFRIHKSHIINFKKVTSVEPGRMGKALLSNGKALDIAARRKAAFLTYLKKYAS